MLERLSKAIQETSSPRAQLHEYASEPMPQLLQASHDVMRRMAMQLECYKTLMEVFEEMCSIKSRKIEQLKGELRRCAKETEE